jgi:hypothetical protein
VKVNNTGVSLEAIDFVGLLTLQALYISLTAAIALFPFLYPRYSPYRRRANGGIETLREAVGSMGNYRIGWIEDHERGFEQLEQAIDENYTLSGEIKRIGLIDGDRASINRVVGTDIQATLVPNAVAYVTYDDAQSSSEIIEFHPFDPQMTLRLRDLNRWVNTTAQRRSQTWTTLLVFTWVMVSITLEISGF